MATRRPSPKPRIFTYEEALESFPAVRDLTAAAVRQVEAVVGQVEGPEEMAALKDELEAACDRIVQAWALEIRRLGCEVKGLWLVDWDCGHGYYCWRHPEETVCFFHGYEEGFAGRVAVV
ncbi:MAG TPA: DUF2203 family protein [Thermoanaerobaculia bacterium]|jgi:hypothetical protein|nr:DUF2203 family protein [Thermoanaerobaculia bacterium]